jgi:hypothetical protein
MEIAMSFNKKKIDGPDEDEFYFAALNGVPKDSTWRKIYTAGAVAGVASMVYKSVKKK